MKQTRIFVRIEGELKRSFLAAARFQHQSLSQFLLQAGISAVDSARGRGCKIKEPAAPRDGRRRVVRGMIGRGLEAEGTEATERMEARAS